MTKNVSNVPPRIWEIGRGQIWRGPCATFAACSFAQVCVQKNPLQYLYCKGRIFHAVPPLLQPSLCKELPLHLLCNGSSRALLKPLRGGHGLSWIKPLAAHGKLPAAVLSAVHPQLTVPINALSFMQSLTRETPIKAFPALCFIILLLLKEKVKCFLKNFGAITLCSFPLRYILPPHPWAFPAPPQALHTDCPPQCGNTWHPLP